MKKTYYFILVLCFMALASCSDWNNHYDEAGISTEKITIYNGDIVSYMKNTDDVSNMSALFQQTGVYDSTYADKEYTFIVCDNNTYGDGSAVSDKKAFAQYCVSNMSVAPPLLVEGFGIHSRSGKNIWVYGSDSSTKLDEYNITKTVKTNNGYIYYIDGILPIRLSAYEYLQTLGENYSSFKSLVAKYEERIFDKEKSAITGVNQEGKTTYDTVWTTKNELMDRYTADGIDYWNMRDESFVTTMFIPTNAQIETAINNALDSIPVWLNREATAADKEKFEKWIVRACFADKRLSEAQVGNGGTDFECVGGYQKIIDEIADQTTYKSIDPAYWRPSIQKVNTGSKVSLSNGVAYYCNSLKIPNHIVIYRVKSRFYELWNAMSDAQKSQYFKWNNWIEPMIINDCQGEFTLSETLPTMYYHELTAIPDTTDLDAHCSVTYSGLVYNADEDEVLECHLPAGEYYLRMGFKHSLTYSLSIYFNDSLLIKDMVMYAQGSNYHFDRGAASEIPHYGLGGIAYPEGYDVDYWQALDPKAIAYDTDGYTVGVVNLKKSGNFKIMVNSKDNTRIYHDGGNYVRNKNNVAQLMMYHWCLRPTINNY